MNDSRTTEQKVYLRLAVATCDVGGVIHAGGDAIREVRTFKLPDDAREYIEKARKQTYVQVTLMVDVTEESELHHD